MAITFGTHLGFAQSQASGTTAIITTGATAAVGKFIIVAVACDPATASTPTISATDSAGNTYTLDAYNNNFFAIANGVVGAILSAPVTSQLNSGGTITVTFGTAITAKVAQAFYGDGIGGLRSATTASGLSASPSVTDANPQNGDLVIGRTMIEDTGNTATLDSDTTNGSWTTDSGRIDSQVGSNHSGVEMFSQSKIVNANGSQTYDIAIGPTDAWVSIAAVYSPPSPTTVTPAVVALSVVVPAPSIAFDSTVTPAVVAVAVTTPAAGTSTDIIASVGVVALSVSIPSPDIHFDMRVTPGVVARSVVVPAPALSQAIRPSAIAIIVTPRTPTILFDDRFTLGSHLAVHVTVPEPIIVIVNTGLEPCINCGRGNPCNCDITVTGGLLSITGSGAESSPFVIDLTCEAIEDCVADLLSGVGFAYQDSANNFITSGSDESVLLSNGDGTASWYNVSTVTFSYTGAVQHWTVPGGATSVLIEAHGGSGTGAGTVPGGLSHDFSYGGMVRARFPVSGGAVYDLYVGGGTSVVGSAGSNWPDGGLGATGFYLGPTGSGRGGGSSSIRPSGDLFVDSLIVAAGAGGVGDGGGATGPGGEGRYLTGEDGANEVGSGGSQVAGGTSVEGGAGSSGQGGAGVVNVAPHFYQGPGGGGGGGWFGGAGGSSSNYPSAAGRGGGGGSGYVAPSGTDIDSADGENPGHGYIVLTYAVPA